MNIFYLHQSAIIAAEMHADIHVGKLLLECCQMLSTAHHEHGNGDNVTYKPAHLNHPCTVWVRESRLHYMYVATLADHLGRQFELRFGHPHKSAEVLHKELKLCPPAMNSLPCKWRNPPLAMPDAFKSDDAIESYRKYYSSKADTMNMVWHKGNRLPPQWFTMYRNELEKLA